MPLTRDFRETIQARVERDSGFREELLKEGVDCLLSGEVEVGKTVLRDFINATVGFHQSWQSLPHRSADSLQSANAPVSGLLKSPTGEGENPDLRIVYRSRTTQKGCPGPPCLSFCRMVTIRTTTEGRTGTEACPYKTIAPAPHRVNLHTARSQGRFFQQPPQRGE
ncbi:MAG: hypothetical protein OXL41_10710 [Nitrospinae bacterium]|nr:hypothetical protein [Nitrospinota bacterium]